MRVLLIDDHPSTRLGLKVLLAALKPELDVVEVGTLAEALDIGKRGESFDLVVLDVRLPDGNGVEHLTIIKHAFETAPIVIMSAETDRNLILSAIESGASGYITKDAPNEVTLNAWRLVLAGWPCFPPHALPQRPRSGTGAADTVERRPWHGLTDGELAVLQKLMHGNANKVIARQLAISESGVKKHLEHIFGKLGVSSRTEAIVEAQRLGVFERFSRPSP